MDAAKLSRIAHAADAAGIARTTLLSAVERGEVRIYRTACGLPLVRQEDVSAWALVERKRGPKPAAS